jgi:alpha-maltose-1-phosphate synthase
VTILFGHPSGSPFSHHAALSHFEAHRLEAFCVPWMPSPITLQLLGWILPLRPMVRRLGRRYFSALAAAPKIQGRIGEIRRLIRRGIGLDHEAIAYEANDWLMTTMRRECRRPGVGAVHSYEDCSLLQFQEARHLGKACIYDMPIGFYTAWENKYAELIQQFEDWLPSGRVNSDRYVRPQQKREEMELADLVLVPSSFAANTIRAFHPNKAIALAPYGVDLEFWTPGVRQEGPEILRFIYAGQNSLRKGIPTLLQAWEKAELQSAELELVGPWYLSNSKKASLPRGVVYLPALSSAALRARYRSADVFVFPSFFEGFGLVLLEAMASGLPVIASEATVATDVLTEACGRVLPAGNVDILVETLRWFSENRNCVRAMGRSARKQAELFTWERYRAAVRDSTSGFA